MALPPFTGDEPAQVINQHLQASPPSLHEKDANIPRAIEEVVLKALAKNPQERYARVQDFANLLENTFSQLKQLEDLLNFATRGLQSTVAQLQTFEKNLAIFSTTIQRVRHITLLQKEVESTINDVIQLLRSHS